MASEAVLCPHCQGTGEVSDSQRKGRSASARLALARASRNRLLNERNLILLWAIKGSGCDDAHVITLDTENDWKHVLCVHIPGEQQLHWKLSPDDYKLFKKLGSGKNDHNKPSNPTEKLARIKTLGT